MPKDVERRQALLNEIRGIDEEKRQFTARVVNYNVVDSYGSVWAPGVFTRSLERKLPKVTWGHDWLDPIGVVIESTDRADGLDLRVQLDDFDAVPRARQAFAQLKSGSMDEFSFGFKREEWSEKREDLAPFEGQQYRARELMTEARMDEMSLVLVGAVPGTKVLDVRSQEVVSDAVTLLTEVRAGRLSVDDAVRQLTTTLGNDDDVDAADGAMVALLPDPDTTTYLMGLKGRGVKADDLHMTLTYLGKAADVPETERTTIIGAVTSWAAGQGPVAAEVAGTAYLGPDKARVVLVESGALIGVFMDVQEQAPQAEHDRFFIPHVTLSFTGPLPLPDDDHTLIFDRVLVAFATSRTVIDLVGPIEPSTEVDDLDSAIADALGMSDWGW